MAVQLDSSLKLNIKTIDDQHQELVNIINKLIYEINHLSLQTNIDYIFQDIFKYTQYHFQTEENYLKQFNCDPAETQVHIQEHRKFIQKVN